MYKVDKIKNLFDCDLCHKVLVDPISIPCGNNVCKSHLDKLLINVSKDKTSFPCELCKEEHSIPKNGFVVNKRMQSGLEIQFNTLKLTPVFDECKQEIKKANENLEKVKALEKDSESYIYEYFADIKRQVDIRREDLKVKIDKYSDEVIQSIEDTQVNYIKLSKQVNQISTDIEQSKKELDNFTKRFDTFEINDKKFKAIKQGVVAVNQTFDNIIIDYNNSLVGNKEYSFAFMDRPISDIFGCFYDANFDSVILNTGKLQSDLTKLCEFPNKHVWDLKYRASRDGFSAKNFHSKCDGIPNTLTIIKSTNGNIFGGYAEEAWTSGTNVTDQISFIISLINKENKPFVSMFTSSPHPCQHLRQQFHELYCDSSYGPSFGHDTFNGTFDIRVSSNSNVNHASHSDFGYSFKHPDYPAGSAKARSILAGSYNFQTVEIEVFTMSFKGLLCNIL